MYIYIYTYIYKYIYIIYVYISKYIHIYILHLYLYLYIIYIYITCFFTNTFIHFYIYIYLQIIICIYIHIGDETHWKTCPPNHKTNALQKETTITTEQPVGFLEISFSHQAPTRLTSFCPKTSSLVRSIHPITFTLSVETWALTAVALRMVSTSAGISMSPTKPTQQ